MQEQLTKMSPTLGRDAVYSRIVSNQIVDETFIRPHSSTFECFVVENQSLASIFDC